MNNPKIEVSYGTIKDSDTAFSATPEDRYTPFKIKKKRHREEMWVAPEHRRHASYMQRAYDIDDKGRKMVELGKRLVLDPLPVIMRKDRNPIFLGLDQHSI